MLAALTRATDWVWITGNHDRGQVREGTSLAQLELGGLVLRHETEPGETRPELSGHWHPRLRVNARGRMIARPCWVRSETRLVLPAFGALTGGMDAADPAIIAALQPAQAVDAVLSAKGRLIQYPLWRAAA